LPLPAGPPRSTAAAPPTDACAKFSGSTHGPDAGSHRACTVPSKALACSRSLAEPSGAAKLAVLATMLSGPAACSMSPGAPGPSGEACATDRRPASAPDRTSELATASAAPPTSSPLPEPTLTDANPATASATTGPGCPAAATALAPDGITVSSTATTAGSASAHIRLGVNSRCLQSVPAGLLRPFGRSTYTRTNEPPARPVTRTPAPATLADATSGRLSSVGRAVHS
jgi:hypothetical protein